MLGRPIEILLVEDNPGDVRLTIEAFRDNKIKNNMHVAEDGERALDFLHRRNGHEDVVRPDLILLDLNLPKISGREVLEDIKQDESLKRIPVVILTTSEATEDVVRSYDLHANSYVTKPVDFGQFIKVVRTIEDFWLTVVRLPQE